MAASTPRPPRSTSIKTWRTAHGVTGPDALPWRYRVYADEHIEMTGVHQPQPGLHVRLLEQRHGRDALDGFAGVVPLQEHRDPVVGLVPRSQELQRGGAIDARDERWATDGAVHAAIPPCGTATSAG